MRTNFNPGPQAVDARRQAIEKYADSGTAVEAFKKAGDGDFAAADQIAEATGTNRLDVLAFVRDTAEDAAWTLSSGHGKSAVGAEGLSLQQSGKALGAGGTVAHLTGFKDFGPSETAKTGEAKPLNAITGTKPVPSKAEVEAGQSLIDQVSVADQHAHEIGSAPTDRIGESVVSLHEQTLEVKQGYLQGLKTEADAITKGQTKPFVVNSLDTARNIASSEVIASPKAEDGFRGLVAQAKTLLTEAASTPAGPLRTIRLNAAEGKLKEAKAEAGGLQTDAAAKFVSLAETLLSKPQGELLTATAALQPFQPGVLNQMMSALTESIENASGAKGTTGVNQSDDATMGQLADAVLRLRNAASLQKPNDKTWNQVDGQINGAMEFFVRYKSVLGTHAGKMDGAGVAEIAKRRASNNDNNLGYQEIRADLDTDRYSRRFDLGHTSGMLTKEGLVEAAAAFAKEVNANGQDAYMTYALTKREVIANPADPDEANIEAPAYAKQAEMFVDAFFESDQHRPTVDAKTLQSGINGIDHGGRETTERAPMLFMRSHGKRVVNNTLALQSSVASISPSGKSFITKAVDGLLEDWLGVDKQALDPTQWQATAGGKALNLGDTAALQKDLGELGRQTPMDWNVQAGTLSIEEMSQVNREVLDALRTHSAMTGEVVDVPQLGATMHTGEQIRSCAPDVLLDQVIQSLAMGADRLGHGVILGTPMESLYETGKDGREWPTVMSESDRADPQNAIFSKSKADVAALDQKRAETLDRVIERGVVIEVNITSNLVINDQTPMEHCINTFAQKMHEGLRFTINTDDETILSTDIKGELSLAHSHLKMDIVDVTRVILESFRSRLGGKPLRNRDALAAQYKDSVTPRMMDGTPEQVATRVKEFSEVMGVPLNANRSHEDQIALVIDKAFA